MQPFHQNDRPGSPRNDAPRSVHARVAATTQRISRAAALALYERELAYYRADAPYLSVEKCAQRCVQLSLLLTAAERLSDPL